MDQFISLACFTLGDVARALATDDGAALYQCGRRLDAFARLADEVAADRPCTLKHAALIAACDGVQTALSRACLCLSRCEGTPERWRVTMARVLQGQVDRLQGNGDAACGFDERQAYSPASLDRVEDDAWELLSLGEDPAVVLNFLLGLQAWRDLCVVLSTFARRRF